jgi:hypothetical protein
MNIINSVVIPSVIFLVLDGAYWFLFKNYLNDVFGKSDSVYTPASMKTLGFGINILIELFALVYFLILGYFTVLNAFIFGVVIQGYTTSINYAIIKDWDLNHGIVCTLWKGVLFALTVYLARYVF